MSEISTTDMVKNLSKSAHAEENKGHLEQAANLYRAIITLQEMAHFPASKLKEAKQDVQRIEEKHFDALVDKEMDRLEKFYSGKKYDLNPYTKPKDSNDNGIFRQKKPKDSNDNGIFRSRQQDLFFPDADKIYEI